MALVIKVSYETEPEIMEVDRCLSALRLIRKDAHQDGKYKRTYFRSKELVQHEREARTDNPGRA